MKQYTKAAIAIAVLIIGLVFIINSFKNSSQPPAIAQPPDITAAPARLYGTIEPAGREVYVSPPLTRQVTVLYAQEGDSIKAGQRLCDLENSIEQQEVELAEAKVALSQKALELNLDEVKRTKRLFAKRIDSEYKYTQALIQKETELKRLKVVKHELHVAKARLEQTILRAPIDGVVYKFDVRLGETLQSGDNSRIILGSPELWARLQVESYWKDRVQDGMSFKIYDTETSEFLGTGSVIRRMPYMGRRDFRTEDAQERFDTKFQEVILALTPEKEGIPIGLSIVAELQ